MSPENTFIKSQEYIKEDHQIEDLFDWDEEIENFSNTFDFAGQTGIIGLVGAFGSGKSTLLHNIKKERDTNNEKWVEFDAWKFPERKRLWDGFILELVKQVKGKEFRNQVKDEIEGDKNNKKEVLTNIIGEAVKSVPVISAIKEFSKVFQDSPATRVFELQKILKNFLQNLDQNKDIESVFIITEDVDRSGEEGLVFLETLNQFLSNLELDDLEIKVITPIGKNNFEENGNRVRFNKCLDHYYYFNPNYNWKKFIVEVFVDDISQDEVSKKQLSQFLRKINNQSKNLNPRLLKIIFRNAEINYKRMIDDGYNPLPQLCILFESTKHLENISTSHNFKGLKSNKKFLNNQSIFNQFAFSLYKNHKIKSTGSVKMYMKKGKNDNDNFFTEKNARDGKRVYINDFYLDY